MIINTDYKGFRIEINAIAAEGRWNASVRIRRLFSEEKPRVEIVTCLKLTPDHAEHNAAIWARRWVDLHRI